MSTPIGYRFRRESGPRGLLARWWLRRRRRRVRRNQRGLLGRSARSGLVGAAIGGLVVLGAPGGPAEMSDPDPRSAPPATAVGTQLMTRYACWSGPAPADMRGVVPLHALVTLDDRVGPVIVDSSVGFGIWLHHRPGTLWGFCRR